MTEKNTFVPQWVSAPGDTIADILAERGISHAEFTTRMQSTPKQIEDLLRGRAVISAETARKLEQVVGSTEEFWLVREAQYRRDLAKRLVKSRAPVYEAWLNELPIKDMRKYGWLAADLSAVDPVAACLDFFGVPTISAWRDLYKDVLASAAFRSSPTFDSRAGSIAAWLRQGEIESASLPCEAWNLARFRKALSEIRPLTRKRDPKVFLPELVQQCAACGVAVVVVRAPVGCRASGATKFLSPNKALLQLSFRYLSDDHFWFTFFHEAGHLILHSKNALFLEGAKNVDAYELEANEFAARVLVPGEFQKRLQDLPIDRHEIRNFAKLVGVSPGIIVGQLQHIDRAGRNQMNMLKVRFEWTESAE